MLNCGLDKKEKIFNKCKGLVDAVGKSKCDGSSADNWNLAWVCLQLQGSKSTEMRGKELR
ncbi:hypothetical protein VP01_7492g1 [Puccinia sorghi]|uniref:Uncharacterized protein n=1 Tax=Puccinia sorghi TaxID=27349 RepID=A0A0L6UC83_9BASI|nr:hypothetical protein VP01_7492g1 [Puccinia sorghi]